VKFIIKKKGFCEISKQGHHLVNRIAGCYEMLTTDTERNESRFGISESLPTNPGQFRGL